MKAGILLLLLFIFSFQVNAQRADCIFKKPPQISIHFGSGAIADPNIEYLSNYDRVRSSCPTDGHYSFASFTSECFRGDWFNLDEDHTPADASGNMLIVNSSYNTGTFFKTTVTGLKGGMIYQFGMWLMNVCRITDKCPFPLLPNLHIRLQTSTGKIVAQFVTGEIARVPAPKWAQHTAVFTMPSSETSLTLVMVNNQPGGCGNDFAVDDITFTECTKPPPVVKAAAKPPVVRKQPTAATKQVAKKPTTATVKTPPQRNVKVVTPQRDSQSISPPVVSLKPRSFPPPPAALRTRTNDVVKRIETEAGQITVNLYDNGEIDGDTISIYHNNVRIMSHARLSAKPVSISIAIDPANPHHEVVMVAENLGSIPPNTSLMIITAGNKRYEVFISSTEQRNAKVVFDLKE